MLFFPRASPIKVSNFEKTNGEAPTRRNPNKQTCGTGTQILTHFKMQYAGIETCAVTLSVRLNHSAKSADEQGLLINLYKRQTNNIFKKPDPPRNYE